ncbi:hypothetical protein ATANTOWER_008267 [Ataeniobius toweri]|uniref:Uncharacterized protein n=1 Tax=Ataeniobius toweri TaxID=208326 RepID=A0ABU7ANV0_9TELE|nr:hypothetical protein [Ataeniobius toweri]
MMPITSLLTYCNKKQEWVVHQHKRFCRRGGLNSPTVESRDARPLCDGDIKHPCVTNIPKTCQLSKP